MKLEFRVAYKSSMFIGEDVRIKERELKQAVQDEEVYWKLKSRMQWLLEGDKITKYFYAQTTKQR